MKLIKNWLRRWRDYTGGQQLTLMGELTICNAQGTQLLELTSAERGVIEQCEVRLRKQFPYLELERQERMVETTLKFFTYQHFVNEPQFLELFRVALEAVILSIHSCGRLEARFMASGTIINKKLEQKFSYLSKADCVDYKITASKPAGAISVITRQRIRAYALVGIILAIIVYALYLNIPKQQVHDFLLPTIDV